MDQQSKQIGRREEWIRAAFILLFLLVSRVVLFLLTLIAIYQTVSALIIGKPNDKLERFGAALSVYLMDTGTFLSHHTDRKPWPFSPWVDNVTCTRGCEY